MPDLDAVLGQLIAAIDADGAELHVEADLRVELTTPRGASTTATVTGNGQRIVVDVPRPELAVGAVRRQDIGRIADALAAAGLAVSVRGPQGPLVQLGAGTDDRLGAAVLGSRRVAPDPRAAVRLVTTGRSARVLAVVAPLVVVLIAVLRRRR